MSVSTYSTAEAAELIGSSERWLIEQVRTRRFPGRKVARRWRMTDQDIADAIDICRNVAGIARVPPIGLTPTSRKRVTA
jgi:hypothetical protein